MVDNAVRFPADDDDLPADTNLRQRMATDPELSVWVSASAGTGKTYVLTRRVLRLLLPRENGQPGTPAARILCLTFTKAAASEMKLRLTSTLAKWATLPLEASGEHEESLTKELQDLLGRPPRPAEIIAARRLFAAVIDTPGGLRIMTIHAFCTAILGTFPQEAGLPPQFRTLEEGPAAQLMSRARDEILLAARQEGDGPYAQALKEVAGSVSDDDFNSLLQEIAKERRAVADILAAHGGAEGLLAAIKAYLGLGPQDSETSILMDACHVAAEPDLRAACEALAMGSKTDQERGISIQKWLDLPPPLRAEQFKPYWRSFLKAEGNVPLARLATKDVIKNNPEIEEFLLDEALRLVDVRERMNAAFCAQMTFNLFTLGGAILKRYQELKDMRAALDFDDLILRTLQLLRAQDMVPWVMYKLDGGIDHILVDEAQDTNPEQWEIIRLLAADFFSGSGAREDIRRTIFAVGDEKQSIYSFQRAAPEMFAKMRQLFGGMVTAAGLPWRDISLNKSFRTVPAVLQLVDRTFETPEMRAGMGSTPLQHDSNRTDHAGLTEIWPLFISPKEEKESLWSPPVKAGESHRAAAHAARHIAATITKWLDPANPEILESQGRPVRAGDIMILVRSRTAFVNQLIRALKVAGIPVGGVDRMVLAEQLVVRDLLAVAQFALLPEDDLTLACVLKSPFIGWTEKDLENLAAYRGPGQSLWARLQEEGHHIVEWLNRQRTEAAISHPFEFFCRLVQEPCPADRISGQHAITGRLGIESLDPLEEFLAAALAFETDNIAALQDFVLSFSRSATIIKREQEEAGNNVRIMTVHGAKGLQAPIVILPDSLKPASGGNKPGERLLWPSKSDLPLPLWVPVTDRECGVYRRGKAIVKERLDEEYRRLLYVAMTRAEDRLYICGHRNNKRHAAGSWYDAIEAAFAKMPDVQTVNFAYPPVLDRNDRDVDQALQVKTAQIAPPRARGNQEHTAHDYVISPDDPALHWLYHPPAAEPVPPQPLIPSRASDADLPAEPAVISPLRAARTSKDQIFQRGTMLHRLLQILPDMPPETRAEAAQKWMTRNAPEFSGDEKALLAILDDPAYAPLFGPGSLAEVPVTGLTPDNRLISGQIDRLVVRDDEVWIIDYKTNRTPPQSAAAIPALYRRQMAAYATLLARIYPGRRVRSFLLWTTGTRIMEIEG